MNTDEPTVLLSRTRIFGLDFIDAPSVDAVVEALLDWRAHDDNGDRLPVVVTPNVDQLVHLDRDTNPVASSLIRSAAFVLPDGQPIVWASRLLKKPLGARLAGSTLVTRLWPRLVEQGRPALVIAASPDTAERVKADMDADSAILAPRLDLGDPEGFATFVADCADQISRCRPEFVFMSLGFPKRCNVIDGIISRLEDRGDQLPLFLAIGAAFEMHYGLVRRAPGWMQRAGLEWFFRFLQEPGRLFRRYFIDDVAFIRLVWQEARRGDGQRSREPA